MWVIVEYAGIVAAVSILAFTLGGGYAGTLATVPATNAAAIKAVSAGAKAKKVPVAEARARYRTAPYTKPSLKYLHAVGWIGGRSNLTACGLTLLSPGTAEARARSEIAKSPKVVAGLRKRGISPRIAARTLVRGVVSACE